jgi:hypothetical protein
MSGHSNGVGHAEPVVGVEDGAADLHFGDLTGGVMCREPLAQALEARDGRLGQATAMVPAPSLPETSAEVPNGM